MFGTLQLDSLFSGQSLLHLELGNRAKKHTQVDLNGHHDDGVLYWLDMRKVPRSEDVKRAVPACSRHRNAQDHGEADEPVLAGIFGKPLAVFGAGVDINECTDGVVCVGKYADADGHGEEDEIEFRQDIDGFVGRGGLVWVTGADFWQPPLLQALC